MDNVEDIEMMDIEEDWEKDTNRMWVVIMLLCFLLEKSYPGEEEDLEEILKR